MADQQPVQNFENHIRFDPLSFVVLGFRLLTLILAITGIIMGSTLVLGLGLVAAAIGGVLGTMMTRFYSTKVQDRVIRLEMRLRLREVLPDDLAADIMDFKLGQLLALRFASDEELPDLARKVLDENITDRKEIKKLVKDWQADFHRV